ELAATRDHSGPRPGALRAPASAAQSIVLHSVPRRTLSRDGTRSRGDAPGSGEVFAAGRRRPSALRSDAGADGRLDRTHLADDASQSMVTVAEALASPGEARSSLPQAGWRRRAGPRDPHPRGPAVSPTL